MGQLAMSLGFWPHFAGYEQCDRLEQPDELSRGFDPSVAERFDGVGVTRFATFAEIQSVVEHPDLPVLGRDEDRTFGEPIPDWSILTREEVFVDGAGGTVKLFVFLEPRSGISREAFAERWAAHGSDVVRNDSEDLLLRYVHNHPVVTDAVDERDEGVRDRIERGLSSRVAGVAELAFASSADLSLFLASPKREELLPDLRAFADLDRAIALCVNEVVLDPRYVGAPAGR